MTRRRVVLLVAAVLAALAYGTLADQVDAQATPARTQVKLFLPFTVQGMINPSLNVTAQGDGTCFAGSVSSPRSDAWRCTIGNQIYDPCYAAPMGQMVLACPVGGPSSGNVALLTLTSPLPEMMANSGDNLTSKMPWAVELGNGQQCMLLTGAGAGLAGMRINYGCGQDGGSVIGNIDTSEPLWHAFYWQQGETSAQTEPVVIAWY